MTPARSKPSFVLITDNPRSWAVSHAEHLADRMRREGFECDRSPSAAAARPADVAVYLSCERIVTAEERARFRHNLVVHASDLPRGRGWSPLSWSILGGADRVTMTLFEAQDTVDSGPIYLQGEVVFQGHELIDEIRERAHEVIEDLVMRFAHSYPDVPSRAQTGTPTFHPRRREADSRIDPSLSIAESFNLLRIVDNERYPAFFEHLGHVYELRIHRRGSGSP